MGFPRELYDELALNSCTYITINNANLVLVVATIVFFSSIIIIYILQKVLNNDDEERVYTPAKLYYFHTNWEETLL